MLQPLPKNNLVLGKRGEEIAVHFLKSKGFTIVEHNFRKSHGDIDIIAREGSCLVFVEVKTRMSDAFGNGADYMTPRHLSMLKRSAEYYLAYRKPEYGSLRIDLISILLGNGVNTKDSLDHYPDICS